MDAKINITRTYHLYLFFFLLVPFLGKSQQTNYQDTLVVPTYVSQGRTIPTTSPTAQLAAVAFTSSTQAVVDVIVEIVWSHSNDGSCLPVISNSPDLSQVGFMLLAPSGVHYHLAHSTLSASSGTSSFVGNSNVIKDTIVFRSGAPSLLPARSPVVGRDTVSPIESFATLIGKEASGRWTIGVINNNNDGLSLCMHTASITLITCSRNKLAVNCKSNITIALDSTGVHNMEFSDVDSASDVSCFVKNITFSPSSFDCSAVGTTVPVTMTIQDKLDSTASCVSQVSIKDQIPPTLVSCLRDTAAVLYLNTYGRDTFWADSLEVMDNCGTVIKEVRPLNPSPWQSFVAFDCIVGQQRIRAKATDAAGNSTECMATVAIVNTIQPTAVCGRDTAYLTTNLNGQVTVPVILLDGGSTSNCGRIRNYWVDVKGAPPPVFTCADLGRNTFNLIVESKHYNLDTCSNAEVIVMDTTPPTVRCRPDTVYLDATGMVTIYPANVDDGSTDICGVDSTNINGVNNITFDCSHTGSPQSIVLYAFDGSGNVDSCTTWVLVKDTFPPVSTCRADTVYLDATGRATINATRLNAGSTDLCTGTQLDFYINGATTMDFDCSYLLNNPHSIALTIKDTFGNASTCNAAVTVLDTIRPVAVCTNPTVFLDQTGAVTITPAFLSAGSIDNCMIIDSFINNTTTRSLTYNCTALNRPETLSLLVVDESGNSSTCQATVTIKDSIRPTPHCYNQLTIPLDATGTAVVRPSIIDSNSTDNCALTKYLINGTDSIIYDCNSIGSQMAVLTIQDSVGNSATCATQILVEDNSVPLVSCRNATVALDALGTATITPDSLLVLSATTDNCGIVSKQFLSGNTMTFDCDSVGQRFVSVLVTDGGGNTASCQTIVTVNDTTAPIASCRPVPFVVTLDNNGIGVVTPANIDNGSTDFCYLDTMLINGVDSLFFNCNNTGSTNTVTLLVKDSTGNQDFCIATVEVKDVNAPTALCKDTVLYLDATGTITVLPTYIDGGSADNCRANLSINGGSSINFTCNQLGVTPVQLTVTDPFGNTTQCPANITIIDTIAPVANCINPASVVVYLDSSCFTTLPASTFNNGSTDNCNLPNTAYSIGGSFNASFTIANLTSNPTPIILTVTDANNNFDTCHTSIIVKDTLRPTITCQTDTVQLGAGGTVVVTPNQVLGTSFDNCNTGTGLSYTINGRASLTFDCRNIGSNPILLTAADSSSNRSRCSTTIWVEDLMPPSANCQPATVLELNGVASLGVLQVAAVDLSSTDNCNIVEYSLDRDTFTCADALSNPHVVQLRVTDNDGNADSCTTQLTVVDRVNPVVACQRATVYLLNGTASVSPHTVLIAPTGDNCTSITSVFANYGSTIQYNCDSIGAHDVEVIVTDVAGNSASCITSITVVDSVPPVANCITTPLTVQLDSTGIGMVYPQDIDNGSLDVCGNLDLLINGIDSFVVTCANMGYTTVTLSALDGSGNQANCVATLDVKDPISPTAICQDTTLYLNTSGVAIVTSAMVDAGSTDNCTFTTSIGGGASMLFNCNQVGTSTVQLVVTDGSGNTTQCAANITLRDTIKPIANCVSPGFLKVYLDNSCFASIPATAINNGSSDNCGRNLVYSVNGLFNATFNATNIGSNNSVTLVVRDAGGNTDVCTTTVEVIDTIRPVVNCRPDTLQLTGVNIVLDPLMINAGSTDNCSVPSLSINGQSSLIFDCSNLGVTPVTLIATDISGNQDSCSTIVLLEDVTPPVAACNASITLQLDPVTNQATLTPAVINNGSIDNCTLISYGISQRAFDCRAVNTNPHPIRLYIVDQSGNQDSCTTQVFVEDTIQPIALCQNDTLYYTGVPITIAASSLDGGSTDNCGNVTFALSQNVFDCPDIGNNTVVLTVADGSGNTSTCTANLLLMDTLVAANAGTFQVLCGGVDSTNLAALAPPSHLTGTWTSSSGAIITAPNDPNTQVSNLAVGDNVFYWGISSSSCARLSEDSVIVRVILDSPDSAQAGTDIALCMETTTTLRAVSPTVSTGAWIQSSSQTSAGVTIVNDTSSTTTVTGLVAGNTYEFVWELTNGLCGAYDRDTVVVKIDSIPLNQAMAGADITCSPDTVALAAMAAPSSIGVWSTPDGAIIADSLSETTIVSGFIQDTTLFVWSLSNGVCINYSVDSMYVILDDVQPIAVLDSFDLVPDGTAKIIDVINNDFLPLNWDISIEEPMLDGRMISFNNGQFEVDINNAIVNQYFVYKICNSDCRSICDTALVILAIQPPGDCYTPTAFTPNGDGKNDFFVIPCLDNTDAKAALYVFNRWGNLVFETDNYISDWDGTYKNQPLPNGTYFYILQIEGKKPQNGSIEIRR